MHTHSQAWIFGIVTIATLALTGCQDSNVKTVGPATPASTQAAADEDANDTQSVQAMYGKRTYTIAAATGGGHSPITGVEGGATQAVDKTLQQEMAQRNYVYRESGPVDFVITPRWSYSSIDSATEQPAPTLPNEFTSSTRQARLTVVFTAGTSDTIIWSGHGGRSVLTTLLSPEMAVDMTHHAMQRLPDANPPAVASANSM